MIGACFCSCFHVAGLHRAGESAGRFGFGRRSDCLLFCKECFFDGTLLLIEESALGTDIPRIFLQRFFVFRTHAEVRMVTSPFRIFHFKCVAEFFAQSFDALKNVTDAPAAKGAGFSITEIICPE